MPDDDKRSPYERLNYCRARLAAIRMSTVAMSGSLHDAIETCWRELMALSEMGSSDAAAIDRLCARVDKLATAVALLA